MPWRWAGRFAGCVLLIVAGAVLMLTVQVDAPGTRSASCGSGWDVVAGRAGWQQWWAQDLADPVDRSGQLVRTQHCPGAVNARITTAAGLAVAALAFAAAGELAGRRRVRAVPRGPANRLRVLGTGVTVLGGVLTVGGLAGIALLTADPHAPLFVYVSRPAVVLTGLLLVLPAILLVALGLATRVMAEHLARTEAADEAP